MRRSRFTAYTDQGPKVILAYTEASVQRWFEGCGYTVSRVERGDYRRTAKRTVNPSSGAQWSLDLAALAEAIAFLGLTLPVQIKQTGHRGGRRGAYSFRTKGVLRYHHITVKNWLDPAQACRTLWHELAHAMQAERHNDPFKPFVVVQQAWADSPERRGSYRFRPIEVEARSYEDYGTEVQIAVAR
jgi:hypothetical protein